MIHAKPATGLKLALELLAEYENEWDGGEQDPAVLAAATYIVCVKRSDDGWVYAADDWHAIAHIERDCMLTDGADVEYVNAVYGVATGQVITYRTTTTVALRAPNGEIYFSYSPQYDPTWVLCVRHPDYENGYDTWPGMTPGVREVTIDSGQQFSNGRPSRYWCAEHYFSLPDDAPAPFKRMVLEELKRLCDEQEKHPKGKDPGSW
jgi:hypothetical protein